MCGPPASNNRGMGGSLSAALRTFWSWMSAASLLVQLSGLLVVATALLFVANLPGPAGPAWLLWLPSPTGAIMLTAVYFRTSSTPRLPVAARRFWRHQGFAGLFIGAGCTAQAVDVLFTPAATGPRTGPVMMVFDGIAVLIIVYSLYRLPLGLQTRGERIRVALDAGTLMAATAAFLWRFQGSDITSADGSPLLLSTLLIVLALAAVFAVAKVVLSGYTLIDQTALRLFAAAMIAGSLGPLLQSVLGARPHLLATQLSVPVVFFLAALAGDRQRLAAPVTAGEPRPARRPFSALSYAAVAAVAGLLVYESAAPSGNLGVVVAAVVITTTLVVLRQLVAFRDNSRLVERLDHGATHDALTGLPNRALFHLRLERALSGSERRPAAVALIDLDDFKEVNDTLGHEVGDLLLIAVAERLTACSRAGDTVARLGGDEFVVVLADTDVAAAERVIRRMADGLSHPVRVAGHDLPVQASIGIAGGHTGDDASLLLRQADIAMYAAKKIAGTAVLRYDPEMSTASTDQARLTVELDEAIRGDQLVLHYQPIVALADGRVVGAEALVRWQHPARGLLMPDAFIQVAERTGLMPALTEWVMTSALHQLAAWTRRDAAGAPAYLNINVSARDVRRPGFADEVAAVLARTGVPGERLTLEITESTALEPGASLVNLHRLRDLGIRISLDDFGTGHSTLTALHECPIDQIKLDRSFAAPRSDGRVPVAVAVSRMAQSLGLQAVAEGVESAAQGEFLRSVGYTLAQGYHFARPMPAAAFEAFLAQRPAVPASS